MNTEPDVVEIVRKRLADGRTIADSDVHRLVREIDRLRDVSRLANEIERLRSGLRIIANTPDIDADMSATIASRYLDGGTWA